MASFQVWYYRCSNRNLPVLVQKTTRFSQGATKSQYCLSQRALFSLIDTKVLIRQPDYISINNVLLTTLWLRFSVVKAAVRILIIHSGIVMSSDDRYQTNCAENYFPRTIKLLSSVKWSWRGRKKAASDLSSLYQTLTNSISLCEVSYRLVYLPSFARQQYIF